MKCHALARHSLARGSASRRIDFGERRERQSGNRTSETRMPVVTALYAGILGLMSVVIAFMAGRLRTAKETFSSILSVCRSIS